MGNNYDIILIGLVAVFLILRLRSVLGKRTGNERPPARDPFTPPTPPNAPPRIGTDAAQGNDNVVQMPPPRTSSPTSGPGGRPRMSMICWPLRSGRIESSSSCSRSRSMRVSRLS